MPAIVTISIVTPLHDAPRDYTSGNPHESPVSQSTEVVPELVFETWYEVRLEKNSVVSLEVEPNLGSEGHEHYENCNFWVVKDEVKD